jgi:hypothetical protein
MSDKTYNGWRNYETWNVKLWLDNDEGSGGYWAEQAEQAVKRFGDNATWTLAQQLKNELNEGAPDLGASCYADLLNAALGEVDWHEIAESFVDVARQALAES